MMSKTRNRRNAIPSHTHSFGIISRAIHIPAHSSMTTLEGSLSLSLLETMEEALTPTRKITITINESLNSSISGNRRQAINAAALPQVPGAKGRYPIRKQVASQLAEWTRAVLTHRRWNCQQRLQWRRG